MLAYSFPAFLSLIATIFLFFVHSFVYQGDALLCPATWGMLSAYFFGSLEISHILIPAVHFMAQLFFRWCGGDNILFWKLCFQLGSMVILTFTCVVLRCVAFGWNTEAKASGTNSAIDGDDVPDDNFHTGKTPYIADKKRDPNDDAHKLYARELLGSNANGHERAAFVSPFFMGIIGMGSLFWLFPAVFPFMVCHYSHFEFTQKLILVLFLVASVIGLVIAETVATFKDWSTAAAWNLTWLSLLPVAFFTRLFLKCVHYPSGYFGRSLLHSCWAVFWGCMYLFLSSLFKAFGLNGVFYNAFTAKCASLGNISFMLSMIHLVAACFTNQAYSNGYSLYKSAVDSGSSWPTQGLGGFRSFCWWLNYGLKNGYRRFRGLADVDIIQVIS